jgi:hypothetical protein
MAEKHHTYIVDFYRLNSPTKTERITVEAIDKDDALIHAKIYGYDNLLRIKRIAEMKTRKPTRRVNT